MKRRKLNHESIFCYVIIGIMAFLCIFPVWIAFAVSISDETDITLNGFCIIPRVLSLDTYKYLLASKGRMLARAYGVTIFTVVCGSIYTMVITACFAYATAQKKEVFPLVNVLSFYAWFTTVFGGGVLPWYILCTKYYGLHNNLLALFVPYGMNVFNMFILRNNFKSIPSALTEAAKIDGASNFQVFIKVALPLSKVGLVTVGFFTILMYWNDFTLPLYLTTSSQLSTVQKFLYNMMANISALLNGLGSVGEHVKIPANTAKMAMTMLTILPVAIIFPFVQKYFVRGITVGAVKG